MKLGKLTFLPVENNLELVSEPTREAIKRQKLANIMVAEIDSSLSDTEAFCRHYNIGMETSVNCVIVEARRGDNRQYAAVLIGGLDRADINNVVRRHLDARKISFAPREVAVELSNMEFGAINPIGLPADWPILIDRKLVDLKQGIIGSGVRSSKLLVSGQLLANLPGVEVLGLARK